MNNVLIHPASIPYDSKKIEEAAIMVGQLNRIDHEEFLMELALFNPNDFASLVKTAQGVLDGLLDIQNEDI